MKFSTVVLFLMAGLATVRAQQAAHYSIEGDTIWLRPGATEDDWAVLDRHPELKTISLPSPPGGRPPTWVISDREFAHVARCVNLERLFIGQPARLSDDALKSLENLRNLRSLELYGPVVSDAGLAHISRLTNLEELRLDGNDRIGDKSLETLRGLKNLRKLYFYKAGITDAGFAAIQDLTQLAELTLGVSAIGDKAMETVGRFKNLQTLDLQHTKVTDAGMEHLRGLTQLRWIGLTGTNISSRGFASLSGMSEMTNIYANDTPIDETLHIANTRITEAGLRGLASFPELRWLNVSRLPLSDSTLTVLIGLKNLRYIEMNHTNVTETGEARLRAAGIERVNIEK
jgi:Leucine-rich repeat (LRR) protein